MIGKGLDLELRTGNTGNSGVDTDLPDIVLWLASEIPSLLQLIQLLFVSTK